MFGMLQCFGFDSTLSLADVRLLAAVPGLGPRLQVAAGQHRPQGSTVQSCSFYIFSVVPSHPPSSEAF